MNSIPLEDALPWKTPPSGGRTILICDSAETDGRFILYTLASQFLLSSSSNRLTTAPFSSNTSEKNARQRAKGAGGVGVRRVLWLSCGTSTNRQIASGLRKIGCDAAASYLRQTAAAATTANNSQSSKKASLAGNSDSPTKETPTSSNGNDDAVPVDEMAVKGPLQIISVVGEMAEALLSEDYVSNNGFADQDGNHSFPHQDHHQQQQRPRSLDGVSHLKNLYKRIRSWIQSLESGRAKRGWNKSSEGTESQQQDERKNDSNNNNDEVLLIVDDASNLASLFGERITYLFLLKLRSMIRRQNIVTDGCLTVRCSHDSDHNAYFATTMASKKSIGDGGGVVGGGFVNVRGRQKGPWVGAGGGDVSEEENRIDSSSTTSSSSPSPWERCLVELADGIIDVVPLQSGYSREAHGRLVFTECLGGEGWEDSNNNKNNKGRASTTTARTFNLKTATTLRDGRGSTAFSTTVINYCCGDDTVKAIRLWTGS